jgi:hypothetical protein
MKQVLLAAALCAAPSALALPAHADTTPPGFSIGLLPYVSGSVQAAADGTYYIFDGQVVRSFDAAGAPIAVVTSLASPGTPGVFALDPTETFLLVGQFVDGGIWRVPVDGSPPTLLADLVGNAGAAFRDASTAVISSRPSGDATRLDLLDLGTGATTLFTMSTGRPGPVAFDLAGGLLVGRMPDGVAGAGETEVLRFPDTTVAPPALPVVHESGGLIVIECEANGPAGAWTPETSYSGYTGDSYYRWNGSNHYHAPGNGTLTYDFEVGTAGTYQFRIHNLHDHPDSSLENDCWVRMDGGTWLKAYSNAGGGTIGLWNWATRHEFGNGSQMDAQYVLSEGVHRIEISGRSTNFRMDRFHLYLLGAVGSQNTYMPPSPAVVAPQSDGDVFLSGLDGVSSIAVEPEYGAIYVAETNPDTDTARVLREGGDFLSPMTVFEGDSGTVLSSLQLTGEPGDGLFFPYQPADQGRLNLLRHTVGGTLRVGIDPERPESTLTGPGTSGSGSMTWAASGCPPNAIVLLWLGIPAFAFPGGEYVLPAEGLPIFWTDYDIGTSSLITFPFVADGNGDLALPLNNNTGLSGGVLSFQGVVLDPATLKVLGSTTISEL